MKIKLTDSAGKPFVGSTVVAIYDKSVEYISGGSNVPEIKEFFWKWRRHHNPQTESQPGALVPEHRSAQDRRHGRPGRLRRQRGRGSWHDGERRARRRQAAAAEVCGRDSWPESAAGMDGAMRMRHG